MSPRFEADLPKPPGTVVSCGEPMADETFAGSHTPLAPFDGAVGELVTAQLTSGREIQAIELIVDPRQTTPARDFFKKSEPAADRSALGAWIDRLRSAGIWADRGASPDLIAQLNQNLVRPSDMVICSVLDVDAGLRLNAAVAAHQADEMIRGVRLIARLTGARRTAVVIEQYAAPAWAMPIRDAAQAAQIVVIDLPNDYPQSDPTLMLYTIARRRLRPGQWPTSQGVLLMDAAAAIAVAEARSNRPALSVPLAIHDHIRQQAHFLRVPIGMQLADILEGVGIHSDHVKLRGGDLLRDVQLKPQAIVAGAELTIHVTPLELLVNPEPCIRCGWCLDACPTRVQPAAVLEAIQRQNPALAERAGIHACIECGLCSHVCPAHLPLLASIRGFRAAMPKNLPR
ncbi:MAG: 4Fe-4S binding protein [Planctomycetota bacterium]|nr:4Fe-4S binding protein [Planctomycetota bacterium]